MPNRTPLRNHGLISPPTNHNRASMSEIRPISSINSNPPPKFDLSTFEPYDYGDKVQFNRKVYFYYNNRKTKTQIPENAKSGGATFDVPTTAPIAQ